MNSADEYRFSIEANEDGMVEWSVTFDSGETNGEMDPEGAFKAARLFEEAAQVAKAKEFDNAE